MSTEPGGTVTTMMTWRKSSKCDSNLCLEVGAHWTKSSRSDEINCVEVQWPDEVEVRVRDSTQPDGPKLSFAADDWKAFVGFATAL